MEVRNRLFFKSSSGVFFSHPSHLLRAQRIRLPGKSLKAGKTDLIEIWSFFLESGYDPETLCISRAQDCEYFPVQFLLLFRGEGFISFTGIGE